MKFREYGVEFKTIYIDNFKIASKMFLNLGIFFEKLGPIMLHIGKFVISNAIEIGW